MSVYLKLQVGDPRKQEGTLSELHRQWEALLQGVPSRVNALATSSGVKDKYFMEFVNQFSAAITKQKASNRASNKPMDHGIKKLVHDMLGDRNVEDLFNPIFQLDGDCTIVCLLLMFLISFCRN